MKKIVSMVLLLCIANLLWAENAGNSILILYLTRARNISLEKDVDASTHASVHIRNNEYIGSTELLAEWIHQRVGGELIAVKTKEPYSSDIKKTVERGEHEHYSDILPPLSTMIPNIEDYDVVFLGFPTWAYDLPSPICSLLETIDLSGKTVIPFNTHQGSRFAASIDTIKKLEPESTVLQGLSIAGRDSMDGRQRVNNWLESLGF